MGKYTVLASLFVLAGCEMGPAMFLGARDREIRNSTHAIETARDDAARAKAYSSRGVAYSEKARYSRGFKLIANDEYERLFGLAIQDHNQAVALNPADAEVFLNRGQAYYDRGWGDMEDKKDGKSWFTQAAADFEKAVARDPRNAHAIDSLGIAYEGAGEDEKAIQAYTREMALDKFGRQRLADAYCGIGVRHHQRKELEEAADAYRKSAELGKADDESCMVEDPFQELVRIYASETREYDKAWEAVRWGLKAGHVVSPDLLAQLIKDSGRSN